MNRMAYKILEAINILKMPSYGDSDAALDNAFDARGLLEATLLQEERDTMNLYKECKAMALEAIEEAQRDHEEIDDIREAAQDYLHQSCDGHEVAIYYHKAIEFCSEVGTSAGEAYLEDCGGIAQPGDTFGQIACRIAFATLLCECFDRLEEILEEMESENDN